MLALIDQREKDAIVAEGLKNIVAYLGEGFEDCEDADDINEKLDAEKCGEIGYKAVEVYWYALLSDSEDTDCGTGTFDKDEAIRRMLDSEGYIKKIAIMDGDFCTGVITMSYWINTQYMGSCLDFALVRELKGDYEDTEIVLSAKYCDVCGDLQDNDDNRDEMWKRIDEYIEKELGFLPEYDIN